MVFYNQIMLIEYEILQLRENIIQNIEYLSTEYKLTNDILSELNRIISLEMSRSMMFYWYVENEESINIINELLKKLED